MSKLTLNTTNILCARRRASLDYKHRGVRGHRLGEIGAERSQQAAAQGAEVRTELGGPCFLPEGSVSPGLLERSWVYTEKLFTGRGGAPTAKGRKGWSGRVRNVM